VTDPRSLRLTVIMPVYNEAATVEMSIQRVWRVPLDVELICVDDGSSDGTADVLRRLQADGVIDRLIIHEYNQGKGAAVRSGIRAAGGDIIVVQDADLEYDPLELPVLIQPILDGRADAVFGSRFLGGPHRVLYFWHSVGNGLLTLLSNMFTDLNLTDMETCYKAVRADLMKTLPLVSNRFGIEPELTARLAQAGARVYEVPVSYHGRTYDEGKKIGWRDGIAAFWFILRYNILAPKAMRFHPAPAAHVRPLPDAENRPAARLPDGVSPAAPHPRPGATERRGGDSGERGSPAAGRTPSPRPPVSPSGKGGRDGFSPSERGRGEGE
jgi:glycosyltransferase involved in cell wall biosynthesis